MKWYLAGPMSGIKQFNIPAFDYATSFLRSRGYDIVSPAELDSPEVREAALLSETGSHDDIPASDTWGSLLARDVNLIADEVGGIILLPNWFDSRGARLEAYVGLLCERKFMEFVDDRLQHYPTHLVADLLQRWLDKLAVEDLTS